MFNTYSTTVHTYMYIIDLPAYTDALPYCVFLNLQEKRILWLTHWAEDQKILFQLKGLMSFCLL